MSKRSTKTPSKVKTRARKRTTRLTRKAQNAARARACTLVEVRSVPWQSAGTLARMHVATERSLREVMVELGKPDTSPTVVMLHETTCGLTVTWWPVNRSNGAPHEHDECAEIIEHVRDVCSCTPLVMYSGARA